MDHISDQLDLINMCEISDFPAFKWENMKKANYCGKKWNNCDVICRDFCQSFISNRMRCPHLVVTLLNKAALLKAQTVQTAATAHLAETRTVTQKETKVPNSPLVAFGVVIRLRVGQVSHSDLHLHLSQTNFHLSLSVVAPNLWPKNLDAKVSGFNPNTLKTHALKSIDVLLMWILLINLFKCVSCRPH